MEQETTIEQLQIVEQNLSSTIQHKQYYQKQVLEMENALHELQESPEAYMIVGTVMIKRSVDEIREQLLEKKQTLEVRIQSLEKKEQSLREQAKSIQESLLNTEGNK